MPDISSCYFCSSLDGNTEYPLIPQRLDPSADAQRTVVVCESCREKLDQVFEPIVRYVETTETNREPQEKPQAKSTEDPPRSEKNEDPTNSRDDEKVTFPDGTQQIARLLQNRELPANREEIELLASNAYEIERDTCREILDALIAHGYFTETNGDIRLPDES